jgi:Icc-related predicted phosphoesterase
VIRRLRLPDSPHSGESVRLLAVSDESERALDVQANRAALGPVDAILGSGDLEPDYLTFLADAFNAPLIYVRGNHDRGANWVAADESHLPRPLLGDTDLVKGVRIVGLSWPGPARGQAIRDEGAAWRQAIGVWLGLRGKKVDIVVSHVPPRGLGDVPQDHYHRGFAAYRWLARRLQPRLWIHGHSALAAVSGWRQDWAGTTLINATGAVLVELAAQSAAPTTISSKLRSRGREFDADSSLHG